VVKLGCVVYFRAVDSDCVNGHRLRRYLSQAAAPVSQCAVSMSGGEECQFLSVDNLAGGRDASAENSPGRYGTTRKVRESA
jgi:hypothetical protein